MKLRLITLRTENEEILKFNPLKIKNLDIEKDKVIITFKNNKKQIILKNDYYYPAWDYFLVQLNNIFEI